MGELRLRFWLLAVDALAWLVARGWWRWPWRAYLHAITRATDAAYALPGAEDRRG